MTPLQIAEMKEEEEKGSLITYFSSLKSRYKKLKQVEVSSMDKVLIELREFKEKREEVKEVRFLTSSPTSSTSSTSSPLIFSTSPTSKNSSGKSNLIEKVKEEGKKKDGERREGEEGEGEGESLLSFSSSEEILVAPFSSQTYVTWRQKLILNNLQNSENKISFLKENGEGEQEVEEKFFKLSDYLQVTQESGKNNNQEELKESEELEGKNWELKEEGKNWKLKEEGKNWKLKEEGKNWKLKEEGKNWKLKEEGKKEKVKKEKKKEVKREGEEREEEGEIVKGDIVGGELESLLRNSVVGEDVKVELVCDIYRERFYSKPHSIFIYKKASKSKVHNFPFLFLSSPFFSFPFPSLSPFFSFPFLLLSSLFFSLSPHKFYLLSFHQKKDNLCGKVSFFRCLPRTDDKSMGTPSKSILFQKLTLFFV